MTPYSTFCTRAQKLERDISAAAVSPPSPKGCHHGGSLVLRRWVLTSYVFLVTSFAAILVGKRGIRSHHVKISGRSSLDEDTEEKCASQQWRTSERALRTSLPAAPAALLRLPTPLTQSVETTARNSRRSTPEQKG